MGYISEKQESNRKQRIQNIGQGAQHEAQDYSSSSGDPVSFSDLWTFLWRRRFETTEKWRPQPSKSHAYAVKTGISSYIQSFQKREGLKATYAFRQCDYTCGSVARTDGWIVCHRPCTYASSGCSSGPWNWIGSSSTGDQEAWNQPRGRRAEVGSEPHMNQM